MSVHTIKEAYEQLLAEGYIYSKERSGYFIAPFEFDWLQQVPQHVSVPNNNIPNNIQFDFTNGHVDNEAFPYAAWHKLIKNILIVTTYQQALGRERQLYAQRLPAM